MKFILSFTLSLLPLFAAAQYMPEPKPISSRPGEIDLVNLCARDYEMVGNKYSMKLEKIDNEDIILTDHGFCNEFNRLNKLNDRQFNQYINSVKNAPGVGVKVKVKSDKSSNKKWKINFYASHSFTKYMPTDVKINTSRYQVEIKDFEWVERGNRNFFEPQTWQVKGNNPAQMIDEPTNKFVLSLIDSKGNEFFISAFHPKFIQADDQVKEIDGVIDGKAISGLNQVNGVSWDPVNNVPGVSRIVNQELTHMQMQFEVGYGHRFTIFKSRVGQLVYVPSVGVGIMVGAAASVIAKNSEWIDFEDKVDSYGKNGIGISLTNRIELRSANGKFGLFYENQISHYQMEHAFQDGREKYNLNYVGQQVGFSIMLLSKKRR